MLMVGSRGDLQSRQRGAEIIDGVQRPGLAALRIRRWGLAYFVGSSHMAVAVARDVHCFTGHRAGKDRGRQSGVARQCEAGADGLTAAELARSKEKSIGQQDSQPEQRRVCFRAALNELLRLGHSHHLEQAANRALTLDEARGGAKLTSRGDHGDCEAGGAVISNRQKVHEAGVLLCFGAMSGDWVRWLPRSTSRAPRQRASGCFRDEGASTRRRRRSSDAGQVSEIAANLLSSSVKMAGWPMTTDGGMRGNGRRRNRRTAKFDCRSTMAIIPSAALARLRRARGPGAGVRARIRFSAAAQYANGGFPALSNQGLPRAHHLQ